MRARQILLAAAAVSGGFSPLAAAAEEPPAAPAAEQPSPEDVGRDLLAHASAAFEEGAFREACDYYRAALKLKPSWETACNLGVAARLSGNLIEAARSLTVCLAEPPPPQASDEEKRRRVQLKADLEVVRQQIGTLAIETTAGAEVAIDGEPIGSAPLAADAFVAPGSHAVAADDKGKTASRSIYVGAGKRVTIVLTPADKPADKAANKPSDTPKDQSAARQTTPVLAGSSGTKPVVFLGAVVTAFALGTGFAAIGASRIIYREAYNQELGGLKEDPRGCRGAGPGAHCEARASLRLTAGTLEDIGIGSFVTAVLLGGGTLIYAVTATPDRGPSVSASTTGIAVSWRGAW